MGVLRETAKKNSNYLKLQKGESVICRYMGFRIIPSTLDPTKDAVMYQFSVDGQIKFWTNANSRIMEFFDDLPKESMIKLTREKWLNKDSGVEDVNKSTYNVEKINVEKAWDE